MPESVFLFSGQGSQRYGMGAALYREDPVFRQYLDRGEAIFREFSGGRSLLAEMLDHDRRLEPFAETLTSTPALFVFQYAAAQSAMFAGVRPRALLGYSLGEFVSAALAGVYDFDSGLEFILRYARLIDEHCPPAGMLAILAEQTLLERHPEMFRHTKVAGRNYPGNFVVTGTPQHLKELQVFLENTEVITQQLPVARGYHSHLIDQAENAIKGELALLQMRFQEPDRPVYSCLLQRAVGPGDYTPDFFWNVVRGPVDFPATLRAFRTDDGAMADRRLYCDLGPSGVMANFVKYSGEHHGATAPLPVFNPFLDELDNWRAFVAGASA